MARKTGDFDTSIEVVGLYKLLDEFKGLETSLRKNANGELRAASKAIANTVPPVLGGSGAPQESAILAAAGAKSDRYIVVAVPVRKPKLSGLKKTKATMARRIGFALEEGSDKPQFHNPPAGKMVRSHIPEIEQKTIRAYESALYQIMRKYGLR